MTDHAAGTPTGTGTDAPTDAPDPVREGRPGTAEPSQDGTAPPVAAADAPPAGPDVAQLQDRWRRALADLDNLRKRYATELERERGLERDRVTSAFLPVLDNIDRALEHAGADPRSILEGVHALREQALAVVAGLGFRREDEPGVPFDPTRHEVVAVVDAGDADVAPGAVVQVLRPGYGAPGHQLRPATVTVAQGPAG
ncbi:nucleotide exchange factor GrpE [Cellulomonas fimi]|uniref:nucleotide exchange factor GrpE n=1 Tax=Cellulomonas fimi TaxID=1708 RepID=UPI00234C9A22|nr:nucleotide exchange factor GrpE [Cellulomonas fimi]MDC7120628.1 nucleotide exchange factor GrpE [Cellulomonas fimi]